MSRPGSSVALLDTPGVISVPTDAGTWFVAGLADMGPADVAVKILSLAQFVSMFGNRQTYSVLYDCIEEFFREGGNKCYVGRVVGPGATKGTHNLLDNVSATSLVATAIGPGAWSANYKVVVYSASGGYGIQVTDASGNVLEDSGTLVDQTSAVQWAQSSNYIRISIGASALNPVAAAGAALSAGTDDRASIVDAQWLTALNLFTADLGPGQVSAPGQTTTTRYAQLIAHANANNRVEILDLTDSGSSTTLQGALPSHARMGAAFAPWIKIPGLTSGSGSRTVPASAFIAGLIARNDPINGPDAPSAGNKGISNYAIGLSQNAWDDATRTTLNGAGINVIRNLNGQIKNYGWRSLADPVNDPNWIDFGNSRLFMSLSAEFAEVAENFVFEEIDGQNGVTVNGFHDALASVCLTHWQIGDLFGDTADQAFIVDTGPSVNTLQTIAALELHAVVQVKMSPFAEYVPIQVVKRQTTDNLVTV